MFQPAGVRTLLHMRSSLPVRPSTSAVLRTVQEEEDTVVAPSPRPSTAPAASSLDRRSSASSSAPADVICAAIQEDEEDEVSDAEGDPEPLIATASTTLHQLQNTWRADRRAELSRLCQDMERAYGLKPSPGFLDEILTPWREGGDAVGSSAAAVGTLGAHPSAASADEGGEPEPEAEGGRTSEEEKEMDTEADAICAAAAHELESAKEFRQQLELRQQTPTVNSTGLGSALPVEEAAATGASPAGAADEDARRLAALRWEVEQLKVKAAEPAEQLPPDLAACEDNIRALHAPVLDTKPISELGALDQWIQDMKRFCRDTAGTAKCATAPSSWSKCGAPAAMSKKAMAQVAEARAMEWASEAKDGESCCSPSSSSPSASRLRVAKSPSVGSAPNSKASSLLSPTASSSGRAIVATPLNGRVAFSPSGGAKEEKSAIEQQLDDILGEFDEIDRIHSKICKLTRG